MSELGVRSAAYAQSSDFAAINHDHDIYTSATYNNAILNTTDRLSVMNMKNSNQSFTMYLSVSPEEDVNVYSYISAWQPKLGTLRLAGVSNTNLYGNAISYNHPEFKGWVQANGATYNLSNFLLSSEIQNVFQIVNGTQFKVPALTNFIDINTTIADTNNSYSMQSGSTGLSSHRHLVTVSPYGGSFWAYNTTNTQSESIVNSISSMLRSVAWKQNENESRNADFHFTTDTANKTLTINFESTVRNVAAPSCAYTGYYGGYYGSIDARSSNVLTSTFPVSANSSEAGEDGIPYPSHNLVPALVYVGPSNYTDFEPYLTVH